MKITSDDISSSDKTKKLISIIVEKNRLHKKFLESSLSKATHEEVKDLNLYLDFCENIGLNLEYLSECYLTIVEDTLEEQIYFRKHKKYRYASFQDVANHVYFDPDYMSKYMYGLAITGYFWPNHLEMYRFFQNTIPRSRNGQYLEIGPGHGSYMMRAIKNCSYENFTGIDISETSIDLTSKIIKYFCPDIKKKYSLECIDFIKAKLPHNKYEAVIMGEVLEHVEQPDIFLKKIRDIASEDAYIFITTCVNAPAIDHIYLYNSVCEVETMIKDCGLFIHNSLILPYEGKTVEECEEKLLSVNVAYVLKKTS